MSHHHSGNVVTSKHDSVVKIPIAMSRHQNKASTLKTLAKECHDIDIWTLNINSMSRYQVVQSRDIARKGNNSELLYQEQCRDISHDIAWTCRLHNLDTISNVATLATTSALLGLKFSAFQSPCFSPRFQGPMIGSYK